MASSRVPTRVPHRRARCPLRCADRSSLRSYRSAPTSAVTSASISPCTKCRTTSRRKSPSGNSPLRRTSNKLMLSSATASLLSKLCLTALGMHAVAAFVKPGCPPDLHHVLGHYPRNGFPHRRGWVSNGQEPPTPAPLRHACRPRREVSGGHRGTVAAPARHRRHPLLQPAHGRDLGCRA